MPILGIFDSVFSLTDRGFCNFDLVGSWTCLEHLKPRAGLSCFCFGLIQCGAQFFVGKPSDQISCFDLVAFIDVNAVADPLNRTPQVSVVYRENDNRAGNPKLRVAPIHVSRFFVDEKGQ